MKKLQKAIYKYHQSKTEEEVLADNAHGLIQQLTQRINNIQAAIIEREIAKIWKNKPETMQSIAALYHKFKDTRAYSIISKEATKICKSELKKDIPLEELVHLSNQFNNHFSIHGDASHLITIEIQEKIKQEKNIITLLLLAEKAKDNCIQVIISERIVKLLKKKELSLRTLKKYRRMASNISQSNMSECVNAMELQAKRISREKVNKLSFAELISFSERYDDILIDILMPAARKKAQNMSCKQLAARTHASHLNWISQVIKEALYAKLLKQSKHCKKFAEVQALCQENCASLYPSGIKEAIKYLMIAINPKKAPTWFYSILNGEEIGDEYKEYFETSIQNINKYIETELKMKGQKAS